MNRLFILLLATVGYQNIIPDFSESDTHTKSKVEREYQLLNPGNYHIYRANLRNSATCFKKLKFGRVAFLGGSITHNKGWRDSVSVYIQKKFPGTRFEFINAGIPSFGSVPDAFRMGNDVLSKGKVDLLFVEAAVNDRTNAYSGKNRIRAMEGIVRQAKTSNPEMDIVFMYFVDPDKMKEYNNGLIPEEISDHEKVAAYYNIPAINLAREVTERINNKEFTWEKDFVNLHPSPFGQQIYFRSISSFLEKCWSVQEAGEKKVKTWKMPIKLDPFCYDKGGLIPAVESEPADGWTTDNEWIPADKAGTREGYVNVPMLISVIPGKILTFSFKGSAVGLAVASGPDAGIIEFSIDNGEWKKSDLFTQWSNSLHLPWFVTLSDELPKGSHLLKIRLSSEINRSSVGSACRIRYFFINS
jgi:hypothetical protein